MKSLLPGQQTHLFCLTLRLSGEKNNFKGFVNKSCNRLLSI